jgi:dTDP-4-dehydrorhamnose 3,5-epimerase
MTTQSEPLLIETIYSEDARGNFSKPFSLPNRAVEDFPIREIFWTTSSIGTIRGMHFQLPGAEIAKLVWVSHGRVLDVLIDLRTDGDYGRVHSFALDSATGHALWVPRGFAHGFQSLEDDTIVNYAVDGDFSPQHDAGVRWDSFPFDWPLAVGAVSARDRQLVPFTGFDSPFRRTA